jgi:hypothetical protein
LNNTIWLSTPTELFGLTDMEESIAGFCCDFFDAVTAVDKVIQQNIK